MKKSAYGSALIVLVLLLHGYGASESARETARPASAPSFKEKVLKFETSTITVRYLGAVDVVSVKPFIRKRKGSDSGAFSMEVVLKNTGSKNLPFHVFGEGRADDGVWFYGGLREPIEVEPNKPKTARLRTRLRTKTLPKEIRLQVLEVQN